ncbi:MAG: RsmB/NOP family class I SAM-dependent RNA methyltransferase [Ascidiaceihabitans sp.]|mgnify:FL=1|jgi:16S rRNA (cytosine967-C5)-methyltransferase|tara:strand:- start:3524 stop:4681 length:1158 start_codon:yes stop_codon:yes gene_type:complete
MTPGARVAAAIEILDMIHDGQAVEKSLTAWARRSRFAGSKDRAAVRDHVFDTVRNWRADAVRGGNGTGRGRMIGRLRALNMDIDALFHGEGHSPEPLTDEEKVAGQGPTEQADVWNMPDWILPELERSLGESAADTAVMLQSRAPITLRVNLGKCNISQAAADLAEIGIETQANPVCSTALSITAGERKLRNSPAYLEGWVELQDASSQAIVADLPEAEKILDYCAGGGGKALALAAQGRKVIAHDINFDRMMDIPARAERAGTSIKLLATDMIKAEGLFDLVLVDAPCTGSGAWRRSPEGKWALTEERLAELTVVQDSILDETVQYVSQGGTLVFGTCSVFKCENEDRISAFLARHSGWKCVKQTRLDVSEMADGFFAAHLKRE